MAVTFSADEIFEMAEQIERNGARFYRAAAKVVSNKDIKKLFEELAEMEVEHEAAFASMRAELTDSEGADVYDPDDEVALYLQAMADGRIFDTKTDPAEQLTGSETPEDILNTAIDSEKDSTIFYLAMEDYVPCEAGKDKVHAIIKQEMGHILILKDKLNSLK